MATNMQEAKSALRQQIKTKLSQMSMEEKLLQSNYVGDKLVQHQRYLMSCRIGIYISLPDEVHTDSVLKHLFSIGKTCFIPKYSSDTMEMVKMENYEERNILPKTKWNIRQPSEDNQRSDAMETGGLDVLIVPGRGYTESGHRLGRGKGYYDKYLARYKEKFDGRLPYLIGLAYREQIFDSIPFEDTDYKLDEVIYDKRERKAIS